IGIGSPLMDYMVSADDNLLAELSLSKGGMRLIDENESRAIRAKIDSRVEHRVPGGSAANTIAGAALLGARTAFMGSIGDDDEGGRYVSETEKSGVKSVLRKHHALTGHAITFITSGGERTFATHLGAAVNLCSDDVDEDAISRSAILHVEGYLLEPPALREAALKAMKAAKKSGTLVSIDVADPGLVTRMGDDLKNIVREFADILFMNETEAKAFTGCEEREAARCAKDFVSVAVVKLGGEGSLIATGDTLIEIPSYAVTVVNTNGAGDMYAGGFLYALSKGKTLEQCGKIASYAASRVVGSAGARLDARPDVESVI
ncbi:MAG TPA: adenosine kinase, partial [Spirochaetota bacterium]